jgi:hypothetical protein
VAIDRAEARQIATEGTGVFDITPGSIYRPAARRGTTMKNTILYWAIALMVMSAFAFYALQAVADNTQ